MGIIHSFDSESEEIIQPRMVANRVKDFPETVVATFSRKVIDSFLELDGVNIISELYSAFDTTPIYKAMYKGKELAVYRSMIGGPAAAIMLEEVIAKGGRTFLFFGSCGTLDRGISAGHLIVPSAAYRDEGTSCHYVEPSDYIEIETALKLSGILSGMGVPNIQAKTWTTDAIYRETRKNMLARKQDGCLTVEMECASLAAVCRFRGAEFCEFLYADDNLDGEIWEKGAVGMLTTESSNKYLTIALEAAIRI